MEASEDKTLDKTKPGNEDKTTSRNVDRLLPRGMQRKRSSQGPQGSCQPKKARDGTEEMMILRNLVPMLRDQRDSRLSQMDIIQETINYIDQLHKRVAQRMVSQTQVILECKYYENESITLSF